MIVISEFSPPVWLRNAHIQTVWPQLFRRPNPVSTQKRCIRLPDGDQLNLFHVGQPGQPILLMLHGLAGSVNSIYAQSMLQQCIDNQWHGILLEFRGAGGKMNKLPRFYHAGDTGDLRTVIYILKHEFPDTPLMALGYSLGGNVLLKYLGETGKKSNIHAAAAVSVPFLLHKSALRLKRGFSRFYQWYLLKRLKKAVQQKFNSMPSPIDLTNLKRYNDFLTYDDRITAPLHGFDNYLDYYEKSSCRQYLGSIDTPTLIINALDDPFVDRTSIPEETELSSTTQLEIADHGGHVGFVTWNNATIEYWLEKKLVNYICHMLTGNFGGRNIRRVSDIQPVKGFGQTVPGK